MADKKEKKGFRVGAYAVFAGVVVAVVLVLLTIFAFTTRYTAFSPEKVAVAYTDCIVQTGDGYNAYKQTLVSKNQKFGNFVIDAYMTPYINDGDDVEQNKIIGSGTEEETKLLDGIYATMYDYYVELVNTYGFDNYDAIFSNYFAKLKEVRVATLKDDYMSTDFMFGVFEANVASYGESLTGTEQELAKDNKTVLKEATVGKYQEMFGEDYKFTTTVTGSKELEGAELEAYLAEYKQRAESLAPTVPDFVNDEQKATMNEANAKINCAEDITSVAEVDLEVKNGDSVVANQKVFVVKIGNSWYVDQTNVDTSALYLA